MYTLYTLSIIYNSTKRINNLINAHDSNKSTYYYIINNEYFDNLTSALSSRLFILAKQIGGHFGRILTVGKGVHYNSCRDNI